MSTTELHGHSTASQSLLLESRSVSPVELVECYMERIRRHDEKLNAFITVCEKEAFASARAAEAEIGQGDYRGPLHGIPFAVKDQMSIPGVRVTGGTRSLTGLVAPEVEATVITRLRAAGAILLGTLNTTEFHFGDSVEYPYGLPRNPWNLERSTGGSSSGSASAVAAGLCSFSLGCDTGGSIRTPASFCGVTGLRPTWSRVSRQGVIPLAWSFDTVGPLCRSARDAAQVVRVIAGHDPKDPTSSTRPVADYASALTGEVRGLRVGLIEEGTYAEGMDPFSTEAVVAAADLLGALGAEVGPLTMSLFPYARLIQSALVGPEAIEYHRSNLRDRADEYDVNTRVSLYLGLAMPSGVVSLAKRARAALIAEFEKAFRDHDVLISATTSAAAPRLPDREAVRLGDHKPSRQDWLAMGQHNTRAFALAGLPSISVPAGFDGAGMPLGLHIATRWFDEERLLNVAHAFQTSSDWHLMQPTAYI